MQIYKINGLAEWMKPLIADFKATRRERGEVVQVMQAQVKQVVLK